MKRLYFLLTLLGYIVFIGANGLAQVSTNGLVAHYKMDGDAQDASGNGNHGTARNGVAFETGKFDKAGSFDGVDDYVEVNHSASLNNYLTTGELTISYWIKPDIGNTRDVIAKRPPANNGGFVVQANPGQMGYDHVIYTNVGWKYVVVPYTQNEWQHIVFSAKANDAIRVFKNGVLSASLSLSGNTFVGTTNNMRLMANTMALELFQKGQLDQVQIFSRLLSNAEVQALYQAEVPPTPPTDLNTGLVAHYKMDGNAQDDSGNSNHGTAQNGVAFGTDRFGNAGKAAVFDGVNDRIVVNNHASLNFSSSFTASFWSKMNVWAEAANNARGIISKKPNDNSAGYVFYKDGFYQSKINFRLRGGANYEYMPSNSDVIVNQWEFWSMVYNSTTGKVDIYKNGALDKTLNTGNIGNMTNTAPLYIGFSETWTGYFNGSIDEVRMYNRALSAAEVAALYGSENSGISLTTPIRFGGGLSTLNVGTGYNLTAAIKNNGSTSWVGDVYLKVKGGTPTLLSSNNIIAAGGTYNLSTNFSPQTAQIGQNVTMELLTKQGSNDFVRVATVNGTVNPLTVNIEAASTVPVVKVPFIRLNQSEVSPGGVVQIVGGNFPPNTNVTIGSSPSIAGASYPSVTAGADGSINAAFTVPTTYTERYLTLVGRDTQGNAPGASVAVKQPAEVATLSITSPYKSGETINVTPNGKVSITFSDKLIKGTPYPQSGASRSYRYEIGYQLAGSTLFNSLYQMPVETGLLNTELRKTVTFGMIGSNFSTVSQSGGWPLKFIIKDMYNNQRVAESVQVNINVVQNISKVSLKWDRSFASIPTEDPVGIAADGVARMYLVLEKNSPTGSPIQSVSVVLANPESNRDPNNFNNGTWLGRVKYAAQQNNNQYSEEANGINTITAQNNSTNADGKYWFWYVAPDDFMRDGLPEGSDYTNDSGREVAAKFTVTYADGTSELVTKYILIVRPPLMMVHGWMGGKTSFSKMDEDSRFQRNWLVRNKNVMKPYSTFDENSEILLGNELQQQKSSFQFVINSLRAMGYAANQADYVCHSMGGLMLRNILSKKDDNSMERRFFQSDTPSNYTNKNYQKGWVHKYITINTPHFGSPGADLIAGALPLAGETLTKILKGIEDSANGLWNNNYEPLMPAVATYDKDAKKYVASAAVTNMQTNSMNGVGGKTNFKRLDNVKSHAIVTDIDEGFGETNPTIPDLSNDGFYQQLFNGVKEQYGVNLPLQIAGNVLFAVAKDITKFNANNTNTVFGQFINSNKTQLYSIWKPYLDDIEIPYLPDLPAYIINFNPAGIKALTETMRLWGQFNQKYPDFLWNGDAVVPLKSQLSGLPLTAPNVSLIPNTKQTDLSRFHVGIQSKLPTIDRVFQLMNKSIHDIEFGYLEGNNYPQKSLNSTQNTTILATNAVSRTAATNPYEVYDNTKIKITTPIQSTSFNTGSIITVKVAALDTVNLKRVELLIGGDNISYGGKRTNYEYQYDVSKLPSFQKTKLLAVGYYYINNEYYLKLDSVSISVANPQPVSGFEANPMSKDLGLDVAFAPLYVLQYNDGLSTDIDKTKLNISISNPACLSYNTQTGQFKGTQKGEAVVIFTYDGVFKDTMYVAVGGGGLPYSQQIQTSNVPVTGDGTVCTGATISVPFTTSGGVFEAGNQYIVQLSDASGENFVSLTTTGTASPLLARIPNGLSNADTYKVRVVSTSPPVIGTAAAQTLKIRNQDATPIVSVQSGNWNDPATWSCKRIPSASDNVTIKAGHRVNLSVGAVGQCRNLTTERTAFFDCPTGAVFLANPNQ